MGIRNYEIEGIFKESCQVGLVAVTMTYLVACLFEKIGIFQLMTHGVGVGYLLLSTGFIYFIIRVFRDAGLVLIGNIDAKRLLHQIYFIEVILSLVMMYLMAPVYGAIGIFISLTFSCLVGFLFLIWCKRVSCK